ncbi:heterokaryon incompatibility protein-domain-containing protein [Podospora didyma]|uniref:Heterokaryon incompatibility protein-domain-containing protein n=1 Tax=Podospora didyma TaxID=330526 RepID=A0AAE0N1Z6_9PEZI|nr:heterokaryon incompatibility protein-domain-containing protein [Podospora didyma]
MPNVNLAPYHYKTLWRTNEIRLVYMQPPAPETCGINDSESYIAIPTITVDLKVAPLGGCDYTALSYTWSDPELEGGYTSLHVRDDSTGTKTLRITKSLHIALRHLQQEDQARVLWIDQICINQEDEDEKGKQVAKMSRIHANARNVIVWLGPASLEKHSDLAMRFIPQMTSALASLMRHPWFSRRRIIQEVAFAQKAELWCGSQAWRQFGDAVTLFESRIADINPVFRASRIEEIGPREKKLRKVEKYAVPIAATAGSLALGVLSGGRVKPQMFAAPLKSWSGSFGREMDETKHHLKSYEYPIGQVRGVGAHLLIVALDQIVRKRPGWKAPELLCSLESLMAYLPTFDCKNPRDVIFAIAGLAKDHVKIIPDYEKDALLVFKDVFEDIISSTKSLNLLPPAGMRVIPASWASYNGQCIMSPQQNTVKDDSGINDMYWRTLLCDRDVNGGLAPSWMRRACQELYDDSADGSIDTAKRLEAATWNRRMIRHGRESFGIVPEDAWDGDAICILNGCNVPVVLRSCGPLEPWKFVGEANIHGMMDGEAMDSSHEGMQTF